MATPSPNPCQGYPLVPRGLKDTGPGLEIGVKEREPGSLRAVHAGARLQRPRCRRRSAATAALPEPERRAAAPPPRAHFRSAGPPRRRMARAPPPLLCSVIQTWKVNNTLTSSGVCVLLHGYFPKYLPLSKRGALPVPHIGPEREEEEAGLPSPMQALFFSSTVGAFSRPRTANRSGSLGCPKFAHAL